MWPELINLECENNKVLSSVQLVLFLKKVKEEERRKCLPVLATWSTVQDHNEMKSVFFGPFDSFF